VPAAPLAAYPLVANVAPDVAGAPGTYVPINGLNKSDFGPKATLVDATYFGTTGAMNRVATLVDADLSMSGQFAPGAAANAIASDAGQNTLFTAYSSADPYVWVQVFWTGSTHGFSIKCIVESFKITDAVAGVFEWTASLKAVAKPAFV